MIYKPVLCVEEKEPRNVHSVEMEKGKKEINNNN